jgi:glutaredoxin
VLFAPFAARAETTAYLFWQEGCPHCERARAALDEITAGMPELRLVEIRVGASARNEALFVEALRRLRIETPAVPLFIVGDRHVLGFSPAAGTDQRYRRLLAACAQTTCPDILAADRFGGVRDPAAPGRPDAGTVDVPLLGQVALADLSLPALTIVLAAVDGFNPCAMWVLAILIGFLLGVADRRRMWTLGAVFLLTTGAMYFAIMAAWLNVVLWIGALSWIRWVIGAVALAAGAHYLREFWTNPEGICRITAAERRASITKRFRAVVEEPSLLLASLGIALLAIGVNLIELVCSAGVPAVFTQVLAMHDLPAAAHYGYLLLYLAVFLLDDTVIFVAAMVTLRSVAATGRFARISHLVGGLVLLGLGALMLLRPDLLS